MVRSRNAVLRTHDPRLTTPPTPHRLIGPSPHRRFRWSRAAQQDRDAFYYEPAGICDDYPQESRTRPKLERDLEAAHQAGAKVLRCGIPWSDIERERGKYNFGFWDLLVRLAPKYGVTLIPYVCYTPGWLASSPDQFWTQPPRDLRKFGEFMEVISRRYRGKVHSWELWNEPDISPFWRGTVEQFARMVRYGAEGVRRGDPAAAVVLGGIAGGADEFARELFTKFHVGDLVDVVNTHAYLETWDDRRMETLPGRIDALYRLMRSAGCRADLWLAEFGYADYRYQPNMADSYGVYIVYGYEHTPAYQAAALLKLELLALSTQELSLTAWYRINDLPPSTAVIGDDVNRHLGVLDVRGKPKPDMGALRLFNRLFDSPERCVDSECRVDAPPGSQSVVHVFQKLNGDLIVAGWLRSSTRTEVQDNSGMAPDPRLETVAVKLPAGGYAAPTVCNEKGQPIQARPTLSGNELRDLSITGDHVLLAVLKPRG